MIGDRHVFVVRHQRIVGTEHPAGIGGVEDRGEEVGEVADPHRHDQLDLRDRGEMPRDAARAWRHRCAAGATAPRRSAAQAVRSALHQRVEVRRRAGGGRLRAPAHRGAARRPRRRGSGRRWRRRPAGSVAALAEYARRAGSGSGNRRPAHWRSQRSCAARDREFRRGSSRHLKGTQHAGRIQYINRRHHANPPHARHRPARPGDPVTPGFDLGTA